MGLKSGSLGKIGWMPWFMAIGSRSEARRSGLNRYVIRMLDV